MGFLECLFGEEQNKKEENKEKYNYFEEFEKIEKELLKKVDNFNTKKVGEFIQNYREKGQEKLNKKNAKENSTCKFCGSKNIIVKKIKDEIKYPSDKFFKTKKGIIDVSLFYGSCNDCKNEFDFEEHERYYIDFTDLEYLRNNKIPKILKENFFEFLCYEADNYSYSFIHGKRFDSNLFEKISSNLDTFKNLGFIVTKEDEEFFKKVEERKIAYNNWIKR